MNTADAPGPMTISGLGARRAGPPIQVRGVGPSVFAVRMGRTVWHEGAAWWRVSPAAVLRFVVERKARVEQARDAWRKGRFGQALT